MQGKLKDFVVPPLAKLIGYLSFGVGVSFCQKAVMSMLDKQSPCGISRGTSQHFRGSLYLGAPVTSDRGGNLPEGASEPDPTASTYPWLFSTHCSGNQGEQDNLRYLTF